MFDIVLRNGSIVDGSGGPAFRGDIAVAGGRIVAVAAGRRIEGAARRVVEADGLVVTPGFVDIHTHYDAQATWDPYLSPSGGHGVTTAVMGNCGVGFAPVIPGQEDFLIKLMEGVEDIPGAALSEGIQWSWGGFPQYLDALAGKARAVDIAAQLPHGALRVFVMGERGARNEPARADDIARMGVLAAEAVRAGALGFSTSRSLLHKSSDGELVPGTFAAEDELAGIGRAIAEAGAPVFQMTTNHIQLLEELPWMERLSRDTGLRVCFNLVQIDEAPELWREVLARAVRANEGGAHLVPNVAGRPAGILMGFELTAHPFVPFPSFRAVAAAARSPAELRARLQDPAVRAAILADTPVPMGPFETYVTRSFHKMFLLGEHPEYEPAPEASIAAAAARTGRPARELAYDALAAQDGRGLLYFPLFNYSGGTMAALYEQLAHPSTRLSLGDGGAHCGAICDASISTFLLTHWARDRSRGPRLSLESVVRKQTRETAECYGLLDRGLIAEGLKADLNVIDLKALALRMPQVAYDLPAGGRRLVQYADGYRMTIQSGAVTLENGQPTGALPGSLIRHPQPAPRV